MRMYDIIEHKKLGEVLSEEEINYFVEHYTDGKIPDYQVAALLMAIYFQGMNDKETLALTMAMAKSGDMLDLSEIKGTKVDKHSTGGVGDKTTLIIAPMVAALDIPVAKMSGRGLGHTGGTIDKLEAFDGFDTKVEEQTFIDNVNNLKIAIAGQTANLAPADKKLYALRDVTATVDNMSLIASSIMSKKIASGANAIVLDVKTGSGAFMKKEKDAVKLAEEMVAIGTGLGRDTIAIISDMDQPLGRAVGNSLEVIEAIETLKGNGPEDLVELCLTLGSYMVKASGRTETAEEGRRLLEETISTGTALEKLRILVEAQGGNKDFVDQTDLFKKANFVEAIKAPKSGYVSHIEADEIGVATLILGGGRETKESIIDLSVGFVLDKKRGDKVEEGDTLAYMHGNDKEKMQVAKERVLAAYDISDKKPEASSFIKKIITKDQ
ncbi:pyrimidine-nucleoside phosphorylase [Vallitalea pronyensis]|uniref:Pyrimidine-nucleoside phosphorylase n=1 Tax=Vallitalea pronyensis TaxID=1348613 RepID=A0A8J8MKT7_9FIRM|nr:pyrimidine-nucleoside phosphorylase [Vallitalea pronyensis]QUI23078.1 pyrimidine-nucleoside phosphorylase [Vallitalea pronyensis]